MKIYKISSPLPLDTIPIEYGEVEVDKLLTEDTIIELDDKYNFQERLGSGMWGIAFSTYDGKVVKITTDSNEYKAALDLIGDGWQKDAPFVTIYEAYPIDESLFVIVKDLVKPLSEEEKGLFDMLISEWDSDIDNVPVEYSEKIPLLNEFQNYMFDIQNYTQYQDTLNPDNIGWDSDGKVVAFDHR